MADAPLILSTDYLDEAYPKINKAIENANTALNSNAATDSKAAEALTSSNMLQKKLQDGLLPINVYGTNVINVLNPAAVIVGKKMFAGTSTSDNSSYVITDYIPVKNGDTFTIIDNKDTVVANLHDKNNNWLQAISNIAAVNGYKTFTVNNANAVYMKVNIFVQQVPVAQQMIAKGSTYPSKFVEYLKTKLNWLDLSDYDQAISVIEEQKESVYLTGARTTESSLSGISFNQNFYGYLNLFKNLPDPIKKVRIYTNVTTANVEYKARIRNTSRQVLFTASTTPSTTGWQWIEFDFPAISAVITGSYLYIEVASLNKISAIVSGATLSADAAASSTYANYYCNNTNLESYYVVNPANSYYMVIEVQTAKDILVPPDNSIGTNKLTDELRQQIGATSKADISLFMPDKVFTWADGIIGDFVGNRVPKVGVYLDHAIPWGTNVEGMKFKGVSQKNRIELTAPYPLDWTVASVNDGVNKKEITVSYSVIGDNIKNIEGAFVQVTVKNSVGADKVVRLLVIGDSTVEGANAFITLEDGTQLWAPFWHVVAKQFAMDSIEANDTNKYRFVSLGTRTGKGGAATVNYLSKTRNIVTATGGESGSKLADHLRYVTQKRPSQATWDLLGLGNGTGTDYADTAAQKDLIAQTAESYTGTEEAYPSNGNPFFDPNKTGNNRFSIAKWLERYRTMDDNGNRLTLGNGTGTKITADNINSINVCTPTHVVLQTGLNDWSQVSVEQYLADMDIFVSEITTQLPEAKIAITLFADDPGTYFPELYPDIKGAEMRYLHDRTRPYLTALKEHFKSSTVVSLLPFYFVMPPAVSLSYRWVQSDDGRKVKVPFGPASNDYHSNGYAHNAWAHQLYAWIKSTLS